MSRHPDPLVRRCLVYDRALARTKRREELLLGYLYSHPEATRGTDDALRRLDDLEGEADRLRRAL